MNTDELRGYPHIVILQSDKDTKVVTFTGDDAMELAHTYAQDTMIKGFDGVVTVACRIRQLCRPKHAHLT